MPNKRKNESQDKGYVGKMPPAAITPATVAQATPVNDAPVAMDVEHISKSAQFSFQDQEAYQRYFTAIAAQLSNDEKALAQYEADKAQLTDNVTRDLGALKTYKQALATNPEAIAPKYLAKGRLSEVDQLAFDQTDFAKLRSNDFAKVAQGYADRTLQKPKPERLIQQVALPAHINELKTTAEQIAKIVELSGVKDPDYAKLLRQLDTVQAYVRGHLGTFTGKEANIIDGKSAELFTKLKSSHIMQVIARQVWLYRQSDAVKQTLNLQVDKPLDFLRKVFAAKTVEEIDELVKTVNSQQVLVHNLENELKAEQETTSERDPNAAQSQAQRFLQIQADLKAKAPKPKVRGKDELTAAEILSQEQASLRAPTWSNGFWNKASAKNWMKNDPAEIEAFDNAQELAKQTSDKLTGAKESVEASLWQIQQQRQLANELADLHLTVDGVERDEHGIETPSTHITDMTGKQKTLARALIDSQNRTSSDQRDKLLSESIAARPNDVKKRARVKDKPITRGAARPEQPKLRRVNTEQETRASFYAKDLPDSFRSSLGGKVNKGDLDYAKYKRDTLSFSSTKTAFKAAQQQDLTERAEREAQTPKAKL